MDTQAEPHWACIAEDEVVTIDNECRNIDELPQPNVIGSTRTKGEPIVTIP